MLEDKDKLLKKEKAVQAFLQALGVKDNEAIENLSLDSEKMRMLGDVLRTSIVGNMNLVHERAKFKKEWLSSNNDYEKTQFNLGATHINPFKFCFNVDNFLEVFITNRQNFIDIDYACAEVCNELETHANTISVCLDNVIKELMVLEPESNKQALAQNTSIMAKIPIYKQMLLWKQFETSYEDVKKGYGDELDSNFKELVKAIIIKRYNTQLEADSEHTVFHL